MKKILLLIMLSIMVSASVAAKENIDAEIGLKLREGITTEDEVVAMLGEPYAKTLDFDGNVIAVYNQEYVEKRVKDAVLPVAARGIWGTETRKQRLAITYGASGRVKEYEFLAK